MLTEILNCLKQHQGAAINIVIDGIEFLPSFVHSFTKTFARTFARTIGKEVKTQANRDKLFTACQQILVLIKIKGMVNAKSLAVAIGVSERTMRTYLKQLVDANVITYCGTTNNGHWHINGIKAW